MSSITCDMSCGKVAISPDRSSERAWFWIRVGQFVGEACSVCRSVSCMLIPRVLVQDWVNERAGQGRDGTRGEIPSNMPIA